jgi:hypothetical protein
LGKMGLEATGTTLEVGSVDDLKAHCPLPLLQQLVNPPKSTFYEHRHRRVLAVLIRQGWTVSQRQC